MAVKRTDRWLGEDIDDPVRLCARAMPDVDNPADFYRYLQLYGMYRSERRARRLASELKKIDAWSRLEEAYASYQSKWQGPEADIYIFPIQDENRMIMTDARGRAGITFPGKIFLFLSPTDDFLLWESLFVHEYHHVCRMEASNKAEEPYTLADSLVFEGLAEHAVKECCGQQYLARWTTAYSDKQLKHCWNHYFSKFLHVKKQDPLHDDLLYGRKKVPKMIGYAVGYALASNYKSEKNLSIRASFSIDSQKIARLGLA